MIADTAGQCARRFRSRASVIAVLAFLLAVSTGCQVTAAPDPTPVPTALPTVTPTSEVTFQVAVTPIVQRRHPDPTPTPRPTRFVVPRGPYLILHPNTGPPVDRTIVVTGGNFPQNSLVSILWALGGRLTPLSTTGHSDGHGSLRASLSIPASAPGLYRVEAEVQSVPYARADYHIVSTAALAASVVSTARGGTLSVFGKRFVPGFRLVLIAYSTVSGRKPVMLGSVQVNARGRFAFTGPIDKLEPGQYVLRAWSSSSVAAEMAQTFFEVVV